MLKRDVCTKCCQWHEEPWDENGWQAGYVSCPKDIVAGRIQDLQVKRLLGTIFGLTETTAIPRHCPYVDRHKDLCECS